MSNTVVVFSQLARTIHLVRNANSHADTVMGTLLAIMLTEAVRVGAHQDGLGLYAMKVSASSSYSLLII